MTEAHLHLSTTFLVLMGILVLACVTNIVYSLKVLAAFNDLMDEMYAPREEAIGFRSETAPDDEEQEYEPEEYIVPGPSIYEEKRKK